MALISTQGIKPRLKLFHNEKVNVYEKTMPLDEIHFWKENNRTIFTFEQLKRLKGKELDELTIEEITQFIADQKIHKLSILAKSIERNGIQVPLIVRDDGKLLDGNRRYFACQWLKMTSKDAIPTVLSEIPVLVIRRNEISEEQELKILAEANFVKDLKIEWSLDAQARAVDDFYNKVLKKYNDDFNAAIIEVVNIFGITRGRATDLLDALKLTKEFIREGDSDDEKIRRRKIVEEQFVYFWEFRNKALKGRSAYKDEAELEEVRDMFFGFMAMGQDNPIRNVKQVEPLAQSKRVKSAWAILKEGGASKVSVVVNLMNEKKSIRKAEDKIRLFLDWLEEVDELSTTAKNYLKRLETLARSKSGEEEL